MEDVSHADIKIVKNLNVLHSVRKTFIEAESNAKFMSCFKSKKQSYNRNWVWNFGDMVYYKRRSLDKCKGSGTVIGQENKEILVKHGGYYIRV